MSHGNSCVIFDIAMCLDGDGVNEGKTTPIIITR